MLYDSILLTAYRPHRRFGRSHLWRGAAKLPFDHETIFRAEEITKVGLVIYVKPGCPYCQQAREHYLSQGVAWAEYDAQNDRARRAEMLAFSDGDPTVPCMVQDGEYIGSGWGTPPRG